MSQKALGMGEDVSSLIFHKQREGILRLYLELREHQKKKHKKFISNFQSILSHLWHMEISP